VRFFRNPRTLFKGFTVPDWATAGQQSGWEVDTYSRQAWDNAMADLQAETTPLHFHGERIEPNPLQWFRFEDVGKGAGTRYFYNEVPTAGNWFRHQTSNPGADLDLYSFNGANQDKPVVFGMDTTTTEGKEAFMKEHLAMCEMAPELISKENMIYPHEKAQWVSQEPHFQRAWQHYREHMFKLRFAVMVNEGQISQGDADAFKDFVNLQNMPSMNVYIYGRLGKLPHLAGDNGYQATVKVLDQMGLGAVNFDRTTAMPFEEQFWKQFDNIFELSESEMMEELPVMVCNPSDRTKLSALLDTRHQQLAAE
jgi:hypothetical protein